MEDVKKYKKYLKQLTEAVTKFENALDSEMKNKSSFDRGKRIANLL